jgi:hypothetical protein
MIGAAQLLWVTAFDQFCYHARINLLFHVIGLWWTPQASAAPLSPMYSSNPNDVFAILEVAHS